MKKDLLLSAPAVLLAWLWLSTCWGTAFGLFLLLSPIMGMLFYVASLCTGLRRNRRYRLLFYAAVAGGFIPVFREQSSGMLCFLLLTVIGGLLLLNEIALALLPPLLKQWSAQWDAASDRLAERLAQK